MRTSRRWPRAISGLGVSLAVHLLLAVGLVLAIKVPSPPATAPPILVQLVTLPAPRPAPAQRRRETARPAGKTLTHVPTTPPVQAPPPPATIPIPALPPGQAPAPDAGLAGLRTALRGVVGCADRDALHLTSAEREACDRRAYAGGKEAAPLPLNIAPEKTARWAADQERERELDRKPFVACEGPGSNLGVSCPAH